MQRTDKGIDMTNYRVECKFSDKIMNTTVYVEALDEAGAKQEAEKYCKNSMNMVPKDFELTDLDEMARYG